LSPSDLIIDHPDATVVIRKMHAEDTDGHTFVLSDESVDRMGDIILSSGWQLRNFTANPVALFSHIRDFAIGTWSALRIENKQLKGDLHLAPESTSDRVGEVVRLVRAGVLKAVSVGFRPLQSRPRGKDQPGVVFERSELLECSLCAIPANPSSLAVAKSLGISDETRAVVFKPGPRKVAAVIKPQSAGAVVEAKVAKIEAEREQLMHRLLRQVDLLAHAKEYVEVLAETRNFEGLTDALKQVRGHETMIRATSALLGVTDADLLNAEREAVRIRRARDSVVKGQRK
jgi:HK97 family phage prohead protease